jgi:hypothetical protein
MVIHTITAEVVILMTMGVNTGTHTNTTTMQVRSDDFDEVVIRMADAPGLQENTQREICRTTLAVILRRGVSPSALGGKLAFTAIRSASDAFYRPVGSGKTALTLALCQKLRKEYNIGVQGCPSSSWHFTLINSLSHRNKRHLHA